MPEVGYVKRKHVWTEDEILAAIRNYVQRYGEVPAATDFHPGDCLHSARISAARSQAWLDRAARFKEGEYPWPATVARVFGRWSLAIKAAGFVPRRESVPDLSPVVNIDDTINLISEYANMARISTDPKERRQILSDIASKALAAIESEENDGQE